MQIITRWILKKKEQHTAKNVCKFIYFYENFVFRLKFHFVPKGQINNIFYIIQSKLGHYQTADALATFHCQVMSSHGIDYVA